MSRVWCGLVAAWQELRTPPQLLPLAESTALPHLSGQRQEVGEREEVPAVGTFPVWRSYLGLGVGEGGASRVGTSTEKCFTRKPPQLAGDCGTHK